MNEKLIIFFLVYVIGYALTLLYLTMFGKKIHGFDYDDKSDRNYDDWESNASAFTSWSMMWPIFICIHGLFGFYALLVKITQILLNEVQR